MRSGIQPPKQAFESPNAIRRPPPLPNARRRPSPHLSQLNVSPPAVRPYMRDDAALPHLDSSMGSPIQSHRPMEDASFPSIKDTVSRRKKGQPPVISVCLDSQLSLSSSSGKLSARRAHVAPAHKRPFAGSALPSIAASASAPELTTPRSTMTDTPRDTPRHTPRLDALPDIFDPAVRPPLPRSPTSHASLINPLHVRSTTRCSSIWSSPRLSPTRTS